MAGSDRDVGSAWVHAGNLEDLKARGMKVVQGRRTPLLVICEGSGCFAVDNRCPHLGFPLHRGSVADGLLTGFHEPAASHLDLLSAFLPPDRLREVYAEALRERYLWHEFGDINLIL